MKNLNRNIYNHYSFLHTAYVHYFSKNSYSNVQFPIFVWLFKDHVQMKTAFGIFISIDLNCLTVYTVQIQH